MALAILVTDVQNDFCEGGSLAVAGGADVARAISDRLERTDYDLVVATRDHHIDPGAHFAADPDFVDSWPPHCVAGTYGAELHANLNREPITAVFDKGEWAAAYSGFEGVAQGVGLGDWLRAHDVDRVEVVGLAADYCVRATVLDAVREKFATTVRLDLTAGIHPDSVRTALREFRDAGARVVGEPIVRS